MSSLKDLASLIMIPSLYKDGRLDTVKPLGNSIIHPDATGNNDGTDGSTPAEGNFTFSRGSNLAATRVDVNGLIEKGRENLLLQSNQFDTTWTLTSGSSIVNGQSGYDSTNNAWLLTDSGYAGSYALYQSISNSGLLTASIYAKAASTNVIELDFFGSPSPSVQVNLTTGSITNALNHIDAQSVSVGNGWWRISITGNLSSTSFIRVGCDGAGSIYIQDAQLEQSMVATDYIETGASTAQAGILEDMPRLDYSGGASCPALLLEPQRSNLITQSEYVDSWLKHNCTINSNAIVSPEGLQNAHKIVENTSLGYHAVYLNNVFTADGTYKTASVFVKAAERTFCAISTRGAFGSSDKTLIFNLTTGEWAVNGSGQNTGLEAEDYGNGWWRIVLNTNTTSAAYDGFIVGAAIDGSTWADAEYTGDGTSGIYVFGAQAEAGSYPTSYIPTYGSSVTRSVDVSSITGASDVIGQTEGTLFAEFEIGEDNAHFFLYTNTSNAIYIQTRIGDMWRAYVINGGVYQVTITTGSVPSSGFVKMAFAYKENDFALYANGSLIGSDTSGSVPACDSYDFGLGPYGAGFGGKRTKQTALFKTRLTNAELAALTTL